MKHFMLFFSIALLAAISYGQDQPQVSAENDPLTPHATGIYLLDGGKLVLLEKASAQGGKTGGVWASAFTYGAKKAHWKSIIPGPQATIRTKDPKPTFYFYFDTRAGQFAADALTNPSQFILIKLEKDKKNRTAITGQASAWGSSSGAREKDMVEFKAERVKDGIYKVSTAQVLPGEYAYITQGQVNIFDFGVDK